MKQLVCNSITEPESNYVQCGQVVTYFVSLADFYCCDDLSILVLPFRVPGHILGFDLRRRPFFNFMLRWLVGVQFGRGKGVYR